ncbi:MAG: hypothetical protein M5R36_06350 [Deltaproteobacteria bacterium]|nr:hypothetical protein [Deltaproteobacteria bacterium]
MNLADAKLAPFKQLEDAQSGGIGESFGEVGEAVHGLSLFQVIVNYNQAAAARQCELP